MRAHGGHGRLIGCSAAGLSRRRLSGVRLLAAVACLLLATGCQFVPGQADVLGPGAPAGYITASDFGLEDGEPARAPTSRPAEQPAEAESKPPYTAPGTRFQQMSFAIVAASATASESAFKTKGREVAENVQLQSVAIGRQALAPAIQQTTFQAVGRRGLLRGRAGLLQGSPVNNLFIPRANPVSARCRELVEAGFFSNAAACRSHFQR